MANSKYYYNTETCHYERVRLTFWKAFQYGAGVLVTGGFILIALVFVWDRITETDLEKSLRNENKALKKHSAILTAQLIDIESSLSKLRGKDKLIHKKIFDVEDADFGENKIRNKKNSDVAHDVLLSDEEVFKIKLNEIKATTLRLKEKSSAVNAYFGNHFHIQPEDAITLQSVPTLKPIQNTNIILLASGFGTRINPFHKGKYMHQGVDFSAPRGTQIVATAGGKVTATKQSSLQAGYGNYISISHGDGFVTHYSHLDEIFVKKGQQVSKGEVIGTVGNSGGSVAPHLHYEIIQNGNPVDPLIFMIEGMSSVEHNQLITLSSQQNQSLD